MAGVRQDHQAKSVRSLGAVTSAFVADPLCQTDSGQTRLRPRTWGRRRAPANWWAWQRRPQSGDSLARTRGSGRTGATRLRPLYERSYIGDAPPAQRSPARRRGLEAHGCYLRCPQSMAFMKAGGRPRERQNPAPSRVLNRFWDAKIPTTSVTVTARRCSSKDPVHPSVGG